MSLETATDVPLLVVSANSRSERRISPHWNIDQLAARLEPITGVPASAQKLSLRAAERSCPLVNAGSTQLSTYKLWDYTELHVSPEVGWLPGAVSSITSAFSLSCLSHNIVT